MSSYYAQQDKTLSGTDDDCLQKFGLVLRHSRLEQGLSMRTVAKRIGLSAHSGVAEYESGRRIPPEDLIDAYERALCVPVGYLQELRKQALKERANRNATEPLILSEQLAEPDLRPDDLANLVREAMTIALAASSTLLAIGLVLTARVMWTLRKERRVTLLILGCEHRLD